MASKQRLFDLLIEYGGFVISSNDCVQDAINQAKASDRMFVDENGFGFIWKPPFYNRFPETEKEVELNEWCYPLEYELPESLKNADWIIERMQLENQIKNN